MIHHRVGILLLMACLVTGCVDRDRANPLDPRNPITEGRLQQVGVVAEHQRITLSWTPASVSDLDSYRVRRTLVIGNTSTAQDFLIEPQYNRFVDLQVVNGQTYRYSVTAMINSGAETPPSASVEATPGPSSAWVADPGSGAIFRTSADGRSIVVRVLGISSPISVSTDPVDGGCWTTDTISGLLLRANADGGLDVVTPGLTRPGQVKVDARDGSCWVVENGSLLGQTSAVTKVQRDGLIQFRVFAFVDPRGISVNPQDGSLWVSDVANRQVTIIDENGNIRMTIGDFSEPTALIADATDGGCWVVDSALKQLIKLDSGGARITTISGFTMPVSGALDEVNQSLWIADPGQQAVVKLIAGIPNNYDITQDQGFHQTTGDIQNPLSVSVNSTTGECWVATSTDRAILKLNPEGQIIGALRLSEPSFPNAISVDPGSRHDVVVP